MASIVCARSRLYSNASPFDSRLWTLKDKAIYPPPPPPVSVSSNLITQPPPLPRPFFHLSFSLRSQLFLHLPQSPPLFPVSDFLLQTNERSEDDTYSQKMNDPSVESEKGREWKKNTNTLRPLIAPPLKESQINI